MPICAECGTQITLTARKHCLRCWDRLKHAAELAAREARAADPEWRAYWRRMREEVLAETEVR